MNGTVTVLDKGAVRIHSYMSPADTFHTTTQLIETPARVIAVDAQLTPAYADEAVAYAEGLGKPLDRLIVTHAHPDHYNGAARFGVPVHALAQVREQIIARGQPAAHRPGHPGHRLHADRGARPGHRDHRRDPVRLPGRRRW
jgi:glyoxylase-like metal-dependent hydrolase (beta-lactamase superfamily II)